VPPALFFLEGIEPNVHAPVCQAVQNVVGPLFDVGERFFDDEGRNAVLAKSGA